MRVLRVYHGGRDVAHRDRDRALVRAGAEVLLVVPTAWPGPAAVTREPFEIKPLPMSRPGYVNRHRLLDAVDFARLVEHWRPDVIDLHEEPFSSLTHQVLQLISGEQTVVGYTAQNLDKRFPPPFAQRELRALARLDGLYPCSRQAASVAVGKGFAGAVSVLALAPGPEFRPGLQSVRGGPIRLLLAGRMLARKGIIDAVRVLHAVRQAGYDATLELIGAGPELRRAQALAARLGVAHKLEIRPWLDAAELARRYRWAHVVLVPSQATPTWVEQFGRMVLEGQASGAVVVGYASGSLPEVIGPAGIVVDCGDNAALNAAVVELLDCPQRWVELRAAGLAAVMTWDNVAHQQLELYSQAIAVRGARLRATRPRATRPRGARPRGAGGAGTLAPVTAAIDNNFTAQSSADRRTCARNRFGAPAPTMSAERPFALPGLRGDNLLTRSLARGIDQWARWAGWAGQRRQLPVAPEARLKVVYIDHVARMSGGEIALVRLIDALVDVDAHVILGEDGPLVPALRQCGATVEVLPLRSSTRDLRRADTVRLLTVARSAVEVVGYSWHLARRLRELQPDLVHTNSLKAGYYGTLAAKLARVPVMWHVRDRIAPDYLPRPTVLATRALLRCLPDVVLANSNATLRTVIPDDRPWGRNSHSVVAEMVSNIGPNVRHHRPDTSQTIGMVGRLVDWKGQEVFIRAFAQAFSGEEKMRARIVGSALFEETAYARGLSELIDQLQLTGRIVLTGHRDDVAAEMRKIDILVHASTLPEPFGLVIIEGMAMGLAVIASDGGGPREIITNEVNGLLTPMGDIDALSQAMRRLHTDPDLRYRLSNGALIRAADFAPGVIGPKVSTLYRDTLARRFSHDNKVGALR